MESEWDARTHRVAQIPLARDDGAAMSVTEFERSELPPKGSDRTRSVSEAMRLFRAKAGFSKGDRARVEMGLLRLPSGHLVGVAEIVFVSTSNKTIFKVPLEFAARFRAIRHGFLGFEEYDIARLGNAEIDDDGLVHLTDGMDLESVELLSAPMLIEPSDTDWRIVHLALAVIEGGDRCYRSLREGLPPAQAEAVPDQRCLDCARLAHLVLPPLKVIAIDVRQKDPTLKVTEQKIADALRKFGARVPSPRPRRSSKSKEEIPVG